MADKNKIYRWIDNCIGILFSLLMRPFARFRQIRPSGFDKILVIKFGTLGDAILLAPVLKTLRENFPSAHIAVLCSAANIEVFENYPCVDERVMIRFLDLMNPFYLFRLIKRLRKEKFDLSIDCEEWSKISAIIALLSGVRLRIGFKTPGQHKHHLFNEAVPHIEDKHESECFFDLLSPLRLEIKNKEIKLFPRRENVIEADRFLKDAGLSTDFAVLHAEVPASGWQRQWPLENVAELGRQLVNKYNLRILIASTNKGKPEAEMLNSLLGGKAEIISGVPILTLYVILGRSRFVVTNNTGFMHLAASAGCRVFALHGPTSPLRWGPLGKDNVAIKSDLRCSPCLCLGFEYGCKTNRCMQQITPQVVLGEIEKSLKVQPVQRQGCLKRVISG